MGSIAAAVSELALTASAVHNVVQLPQYPLARCAYAVMGSASLLGAFRFGQDLPSDRLVYWHGKLSWVSAAVSMPIIASTFLVKHSQVSKLPDEYVLPASLLLAAGLSFNEKSYAAGRKVMPLAATAVMLVSSLAARNKYGLGAVLTLLAAGAVGTEGKMLGFARMDIFHYLLGLVNVLNFMVLS